VAIQIDILASEAEFARYRSLVDSDWNRSTLDQVLALMRDVVRTPQVEQVKYQEWLSFPPMNGDKTPGNGVAKQILEPLLFLSAVYREPSIPRLPAALTLGKSKAVAQILDIVRFLFLQLFVNVRIRGETGFIQDLQSLLFLTSVHYLLPHLQKTAARKEHDILVNAMHVHANVVWRRDPSHMFFLLGSMMGHLGNKRLRLDYLDKSQAATPIDDHAFLTRANAYWAELLEFRETDKAMEYLLKISRLAPASYLSEIEEMIKETAAFNAASPG
jgi:hypothetical protein